MCACSEIEKLLDPYTDGELDEPTRLLVEAHVRECASCSRLALRKRNEARLLHSGLLAPALSDGFTGQVMSKLDPDRYRARNEGLIWLRRLFARPLLVPGLAGLLLLATLYCAASGRLLPGSQEKVALQTSDLAAKEHPALALPATGTPEPAPGPDRKAIVGEEDMRSLNGKNAVFSPSRDQNAVGEAVYQTGEAPAPDPAFRETSIEELERQGYAVFEPGYLPAGYSLSSCYLFRASPGGDNLSRALSGGGPEALTGWGSLLLTYRNTRTDGWLILAIRPAGNQAPAPVSDVSGENRMGAAPPPGAVPGTPAGEASGAVTPLSAQPSPMASEGSDAAGRNAENTTETNTTEANRATGGPAPAAETGSQPSAAGRIAWQAQKNGAGFLLTVGSNSLPGEELQKVAVSVQ